MFSFSLLGAGPLQLVQVTRNPRARGARSGRGQAVAVVGRSPPIIGEDYVCRPGPVEIAVGSGLRPLCRTVGSVRQRGVEMVAQARIELATPAFSVRCSTN